MIRVDSERTESNGDSSYSSEESDTIDFKKLRIPRVLDTSRNDLVKTFFTPILKTSIAYDRGVGYFSSGWLHVNSKGLAAFAENGGKVRWITSPILSKDDWEAIKQGDAARCKEVVHSSIEKSIEDLESSLEEDARSALAWLIADDIIEFRLAVPRHELDGEFHDK